MSSTRRMILALALCVTIIVLGSTGYVLVEDLPLGDALYMAIITVSTVGFGEVAPLSPGGRLITAGLILLGIGAVAYAGRAMVASMVEEIWSGKAEVRRMRNLIDAVQSHVIICGYGRMGAAAADYLQEASVPFVVIEGNEATCETLRESGLLYIQGDATQDQILVDAGIKRAVGLLTLLDSDPLNLVVTLTARELNPTLQIIARAEDALSEKRILRAGADAVVSPFGTAGRHVALAMLAATGRSTSDSPLESGLRLPRWVAIGPADPAAGTPVAAFRERLACAVLGIRRGDEDILAPEDSVTLKIGDQLLILDEERTARRQAEPPERVLVVDDNPVIIRLYIRLLRKAGLDAVTARSGEEAIALLSRERVDVAVVDYGLPGMSGIDVCRWIREELGAERPACVLFTADEREETLQLAREAGIDEVVLKSPEATDLIGIIRRVGSRQSARGAGVHGAGV